MGPRAAPRVAGCRQLGAPADASGGFGCLLILILLYVFADVAI